MADADLVEISRKPIDLLRDQRGVYGIGISDAVDRYALAMACGYHPNRSWPPALILRPDALAEIGDQYPGVPVLQKITGGFRHGLFSNCLEEWFRRLIHRRMLHTAGLPWPPLHPVRYWSADEKQQARNRQIYHGLRRGSLTIINKLIGAAIEAAANPDAIKLARRFTFRDRYPIYCETARSTRALQLAETFPVLARAIYCRWSDRPDLKADAIRLVERGARLRDVAALAGIPMAWRRVRPGAAHLVPLGAAHLAPYELSGLLAYIPDSLPRMRFWLRAVRGAGRIGGGDFAEWVAKNAMRIPGKSADERFSFLSDLGDWVSASHEAHRFAVRPFSPTMSLRTVTKLSSDWHEGVANNLDGPQHAFPEPWLPATRLNGYEIVPIAHGADLYREGATMRHCVGAYAGRVMSGDCYIYSVREDGKRVATAEIVRAGDRAALAQIRGPCNAQAPKEIVATMRRWLRATPPTADKRTSDTREQLP
jgi:hypothetical protein